MMTQQLEAIAHTSYRLGRLRQAYDNHPLTQAALHRLRLHAVRQQAAVDGFYIDPWHLAAVIENLPICLGERDRGGVFDAARHAFDHYRWLTAPDREQRNQIERAMTLLTDSSFGKSPLMHVALALHRWLDNGQPRQPMRAAIIKFLDAELFGIPLPLTGAEALRAEQAWGLDEWIPCFLNALAAEAENALRHLAELECVWIPARQAAMQGRRSNSRAGMALDLIAAAPLISATTLARHLDMAPKNALRLLQQFLEKGIVVEVTHRSARRLFGLAHLAPIANGVALPRRARQRDIPMNDAGTSTVQSEADNNKPSKHRLSSADFSELDAAVAAADRAIAETSRRLARISQAGRSSQSHHD